VSRFATRQFEFPYFNTLRDEVSAQSTKALEETAKRCSGRADCDKKRSITERGRDEALSEIEAKRASARIHSS